MICITGAGGTVGHEIVAQLESAQASFRVAHHSMEKVRAARARGIEAVPIDYNRPDTLDEAFEGCDRLFLLGPNAMNQTQLELNAVEAAKTFGIQHIVKLSVMGAGEESYSLARVHRPVERAIESSGLSWTFLRPNSFMQNLVTFMSQAIKADSALYSASGEARISHVDVRDIATVAVQALTEANHGGNAYTLTGPEALTYGELTSDLSIVLGRTINHVSLSPAELKQGMLAEGMSEELADRMLDLERYIYEDQAGLISDDIRRVTGRDPRRFSDYLLEAAATRTWDVDEVPK